MVVLRLGSNMGESSGVKIKREGKNEKNMAVSGPCQGRRAVPGACQWFSMFFQSQTICLLYIVFFGLISLMTQHVSTISILIP